MTTSRRRFAGLLLVASLALVACGGGATPSSPSPSPSAPPSQAPSPSPSSVPPAPTTPPSVDPSPPAPPPSLGADGQDLLEHVREDAAVDCRSIVQDLPELASAGILCNAEDPTIERVIAWRFASAEDAARAYFGRIGDLDVAPRSGDCWTSPIGGDSAWIPGDDDGMPQAGDPFTIVVDGEAYLIDRLACTVDPEGHGHFLTTCGNGVLVEVEATNAELRALVELSQRMPEDAPRDTPAPPGICYGPAMIVG